MEASKYATRALNPSQPSPNLPAHNTAAPEDIVNTQEPASEPVDVPDSSAFAQTRPPDDLFSDDFTPLAQPVVEAASPQIPTGPSIKSPSYQVSNQQQQQHQQQNRSQRRQQPPRNNPRSTNNTNTNKPLSPSEPIDSLSPTTVKPGQQPAPVRGDRSATGGQAKSKLTEEELNAKMKAMKVKNTELEQAHARSQADEQTFRANEAAAKERQRQDRTNRQVMLTEREKNAQRKIQAQQGRGWDVSKEEADVVDRPQTCPMRGAHGGVTRDIAASDRQQSTSTDDDLQGDGQVSNRGVGRGGRGRGRGGGRGGRGGNRQPGNDGQLQSLPGAGDFPALQDQKGAYQGGNPRINTAVGGAKGGGRTNSATTPGEKSSWADQMNDTPSPAWETNSKQPKAPKGGW